MVDNPNLTALKKQVICLANSIKNHGRCFAGKEIIHAKPGEWIRPISNRSSEELSETERWYSGKIEPVLLDVVEISLLQHVPHAHQIENWLIDPSYEFQKIDQISASEVLKIVDRPIELWPLGHSSTKGKNDFVPPEESVLLENSLYLIEVRQMEVEVLDIQIRCAFEYMGATYNLAVTDPVFKSKYVDKGTGKYHIDEAALTISLAQEIYTPLYGHSAGRYKLIAGVIEI